MERHLQSNLHQLEEDKMRFHLDKLKHQLGIVEDNNDFSQTMTSQNNDVISNQDKVISSNHDDSRSLKGSVKSFERLSHKGKVFSSKGSDKNDVISVTISNKSYKTQRDDVASIRSNQVKDLQVDDVKDDVKSLKSHVSSLKGEIISKAKSYDLSSNKSASKILNDDLVSEKSTVSQKSSKAQNEDVKSEKSNDDVKSDKFNDDVKSEKSQNDVTTDFGMATLKIDDLKAVTSQLDDEHLERGDANMTSQKIKDDVTEKSSLKSDDASSVGDVMNNDDVSAGGYSDDDFEADEDDEDF